MFEIIFTKGQKPCATNSAPFHPNSSSFYVYETIRASGYVHNTMTELQSAGNYDVVGWYVSSPRQPTTSIKLWVEVEVVWTDTNTQTFSRYIYRTNNITSELINYTNTLHGLQLAGWKPNKQVNGMTD